MKHMNAPKRVPSGEPVSYNGHLIVPVRETVETAKGKSTERMRYDVMGLRPTAAEVPWLRKTCASLVTAQGWIDVYGDR